MSKVKRISLIMLCFALLIPLGGCKSKDSNTLTTIRLNEVTRSVFYAPMYAAINNGYFEENGLSIDLTTGQGADKTMQQVLSNSADIGFCGPEQVVYVYNQGREDYPVVFAGLTQKDGSFLVARNADSNFTWDSVKGKVILGGRPGGMPEMSLEHVLKSKNITPGKDVEVITNIAFANVPAAYAGGTGDYVALFEPNASVLENEKTGTIVASVGEAAGDIPYTAFFATKSYIEKNSTTIESFTKAIYKGQQWIKEHSDEEVAKAISSFFPGTDIKILTNVVKNYRSIDAWASTPSISEDNYNRMLDIIESYDASLLPSKPAFNKIIDNSFANKVAK